MPSTYSTSLKLELIANGEQSGTWGQTTNNNLGTLIEQAITGVGSLALVGDTTLTNYNGLVDESRNAVLVFSGSLLAPANVIAPSVQKTYIVTNNAGANVTIKTSTGNGVTIQNGLSSLIYCDGTNFYTAVNVNNVVGDLSVSGNVTISGNTINLGNSNISTSSGNLSLVSNSSIIDMSTNTGALIPPTGTAAQRPATPALGMARWNTDSGVYEIWNGVNWQVIASGTYSGTYLAVAGGGGAVGSGGGGGAGGFLAGSINFTAGTTYTITVGAGGGASNGTNSLIVGVVDAVGGGRSGYGSSPSTVVGGTGGSGGGGQPGTGNPAPGGSGTSGQGNAGGAANGSIVGGAGGGGGGGAGAIGGSAGAGAGTDGANGGAGLTSSITGVSTYYAGGGGGSGGSTNGSGGAGGGGAGNGTNGTANTGGGAGAGASGGSGVVILSIPTVSYTGTTTGSPTVTINGPYTVVKFTSSGTYTA